MKLIKLTAISAAVLASTAALAADPIVVVDNADAMAYQAQPVAVAQPVMADPVAVAYEAEPVAYETEAAPVNNSNRGIIGSTTNAISNTTGAIFGGTKTLFNTAINPAAVSAEIGTLGYGANVAWSINETTELQAGWAGGDVSDLKDNFDVDDIEYDIDDADFSNPYIGVQLRPAANWFTVGAGIIVPDNDFDVTAKADGNVFEIDDISYTAADVGNLSGTLEHRNKLAPYLTVGFRPNISNNWGVFGEIGAAYMGRTDATVNAVGDDNDFVGYIDGTTDVDRANSDVTRQEVAQRAEQELEDKDWLEWFPIVKVGATYRF
ncbi:hypothetical protein [uncultured Psychrobacter sp.]|uniref:hypothetical protein n=1 Tax=uncultured Psychrobacter sp. TaxID=259303 RepID=UPI003458F059